MISIKSEKNVCQIYKDNYMECGQNVNIFSALRELGKENRKDTKSRQNVSKLNKIFVNVHRQSTHSWFFLVVCLQ